MRQRVPQTLLTAVIAAALPLLLILVRDREISLYDLGFGLPFVLFLVAAFLGNKLRQRAILLTSFLFISGVAYLGWDMHSLFAPLPRAIKMRVFSCVFPLSLLVVFYLPSNLLLRGRAALWWVGLLAPLLIVDAIAKLGRSAFLSLLQWRVLNGQPFHHVPTLGLILFAAFTASTFLLQRELSAEDRAKKLFQVFTCVSFIPLLYSLELAGMRFESARQFRFELAVGFASVAMLLLYANYMLYWQRVYLDELTGVMNRRALNDRLLQISGQYAIAMIDIDNFKKFNDAYGHEQGDTVLRFVATEFSQPDQGTTYRYGGEEFCVLFEGVDAAQASKTLDSIRTALANRDFHIRAPKPVRANTSKRDRKAQADPSTSVRITVSIGVASPTDSRPTPDDVLRTADVCLYSAKQRGRNRVVEAACTTSVPRAAA